jgi:hypothetical protein
MKGRRIPYSAAELSFIEWRQAMSRRALHAAFVAEFGRNDVTVDDIKALCTRRGWLTGRTGCFEKGFVPANKGKKMPFNANSARTQFKKGRRPHTWRGPGHERIDSRDGYVILIVEETNPWTGAATRPVHKHRWLWEQANGPVPEGHVLKCLDGNKLNTDPSNWEAVPRGMLPRLAGCHTQAYDGAPAELKPTIMAIAKLEQAAREARHGGRS